MLSMGPRACADELTLEDLSSGIKRLEKRVRRYRPDWWPSWESRRIKPYSIKSRLRSDRNRLNLAAHVWLLPNPSGLNAHYQLASLVRLFAELRSAVSRPPRRKGTI